MICVRKCLYLLRICGADGFQADTEFVFSRWYCIDLGFVNNSTLLCLGDMSRVSTEISDSLSARLSVPTSVFVISTPVTTSSGLSINLTLAQHNIPGLHNRLCHLQVEFPAFRICGEDVELVGVRQGRNHHLYIRNQEVISHRNKMGGVVFANFQNVGVAVWRRPHKFLLQNSRCK